MLARLVLPNAPGCLPSSPGALTLISKVTDRANDSMEQGVSAATGPFPRGQALGSVHLPRGALPPALGDGTEPWVPALMCGETSGVSLSRPLWHTLPAQTW